MIVPTTIVRTSPNWLLPLVAGSLFAACSATAGGSESPDPASSQATQDPPRGIPWPQTVSDLPPDPALQFARLQNGLRYAWQDHAHPPGRCSLRLVVHVGSVDEEDDERGMAHFVEHMAFNGTKRFPRNSLEEWFRQRGMGAGRDVNAFTSYRYTVYCIDLPTNDHAAMQEGLAVLCDFATGMLFDPAEVEAEKGVIDAEERESSSPSRRAHEERLRRLVAGTRIAERSPLGTVSQRAKFTADALRAFHARWYRPDNMTLVLVGDLARAEVTALVGETFGSQVVPPVPLPRRADPGAPTFSDTRFTIEQPESADAEFLVLCPLPPGFRVDTIATSHRDVLLRAATEMAGWTLVELTGAADPALGLPEVRVPAVSGLEAELGAMLLEFRCPPSRFYERATSVKHLGAAWSGEDERLRWLLFALLKAACRAGAS